MCGTCRRRANKQAILDEQERQAAEKYRQQQKTTSMYPSYDVYDDLEDEIYDEIDESAISSVDFVNSEQSPIGENTEEPVYLLVLPDNYK